MGRALPPVAERQDDLREEPAAAALLLPRGDDVPAAVAAGAVAAAAALLMRWVLEDGVGRDLAWVVVVAAAAVDAEVLETREAAAQVRRPAARHVEDVGQVPALHHYVVHLHASARACAVSTG